MRSEFQGMDLKQLQLYRREAENTRLLLGAFELLTIVGIPVICSASRDPRTGVTCGTVVAVGLVVSEMTRKWMGREIVAVQEAILETIDN